MNRALALVAVAAIVVFVGSGCVSARYSTVPASELVTNCGGFEAESSTRGVAVAEAVQGYGAACRDVQIARAEAAYVQSQTAAAMYYAVNAAPGSKEVVDASARREIARLDTAVLCHEFNPRACAQRRADLKAECRAGNGVSCQHLRNAERPAGGDR